MRALVAVLLLSVLAPSAVAACAATAAGTACVEGDGARFESAHATPAGVLALCAGASRSPWYGDDLVTTEGCASLDGPSGRTSACARDHRLVRALGYYQTYCLAHEDATTGSTTLAGDGMGPGHLLYRPDVRHDGVAGDVTYGSDHLVLLGVFHMHSASAHGTAAGLDAEVWAFSLVLDHGAGARVGATEAYAHVGLLFVCTHDGCTYVA